MSTGGRFGSLGEQMALFFPVVCDTAEDILKVAAEMKAFARANPYNHSEKRREVLASRELQATKEYSGAIQTKGDVREIIGPWQKVVTFDNGLTPPIQLTYTEGPMDGFAGVMQFLNIVDYKKTKLDPLTAVTLTACFWDKTKPEIWDGLLRLPDLPPHVAIVIRKVGHGEEL